MYYCTTHLHEAARQEMHSIRSRLEKHTPLVLAILYLASGDYASLIRHLRILF